MYFTSEIFHIFVTTRSLINQVKTALTEIGSVAMGNDWENCSSRLPRQLYSFLGDFINTQDITMIFNLPNFYLQPWSLPLIFNYILKCLPIISVFKYLTSIKTNLNFQLHCVILVSPLISLSLGFLIY